MLVVLGDGPDQLILDKGPSIKYVTLEGERGSEKV